jgi:hypothetical protein
MRLIQVLVCGVLLSFFTNRSALADTPEQSTAAGPETTYHLPIGLGPVLRTLDGARQDRFAFEAFRHFKQARAEFGYTRYGQAQSRLEVGDGFAAQFQATAGFTVVGLAGMETVSPHFGVEPISGRISFDRDPSRERSYEWMPMASAGVQFRNRWCKLMPHIRGGAGLGNLPRSGGISPILNGAFGVGTYLNCTRFDVAVEATRLGGMHDGVDLGLIDASYELVPHWIQLGIRAEKLTVRQASMDTPERNENRLMLMLRSPIAIPD